MQTPFCFSWVIFSGARFPKQDCLTKGRQHFYALHMNFHLRFRGTASLPSGPRPGAWLSVALEMSLKVSILLAH